MISNCCQAEMITITGDEGTSHWECKGCGKGCNPFIPKMREGWEKIFKLGDRISLEMAIDQNRNPQTKDSSKWTKFAPEGESDRQS